MPTGVMPEASEVIPGNESASASNTVPVQPRHNRLNTVDKVDVLDGEWGWVVVLGSFVIFALVEGIFYSFGVFVEDFVTDFDCSKRAVGRLGLLMLGVTYASGSLMC